MYIGIIKLFWIDTDVICCVQASVISPSSREILPESKYQIPYILESNPHPFYSFRGLKNQMRIRIACGLDSQSRAGFWKNDRTAVRAVRTIQYNNLLFYSLFIIYNIYYIIFIIYYSSDSPSSLITESLSVTQSLSSLSSPSYSHRMSPLDQSKALLMQRITVKVLITSNIIQSVCLVGKGWLKERCGLEPRTNFFFWLIHVTQRAV